MFLGLSLPTFGVTEPIHHPTLEPVYQTTHTLKYDWQVANTRCAFLQQVKTSFFQSELKISLKRMTKN